MALWLVACAAPGAIAADDPEPRESRGEAGVPPAAGRSPLADYVAKPDASYRWVKRRQGRLGRGEFVELTLTSQTWKGILWQHQLFVYRPAQVDHAAQGLLLVAGGVWDDRLAAPAERNEELPRALRTIAAAGDAMRAPTAAVLQVPQQPIFGGMVEDQIISYTFVRYFLTQDAEWPLLAPMVKSAARAMDAVQQVAQDEWGLKIERFTVTGASKRGWTTWLTAAVDSRVTALAPMVIDVLNFRRQLQHQLESYGRLSENLHDYTDKGLQLFLDTPRGRELQEIVDPYFYRDAIKQPKLILLGTNDRYWTLDALNMYWNDLPGEKFVLYVPNNGHALQDHPRLIGTIAALHRRAATGEPLPKLDWKFDEGPGSVVVGLECSQSPQRVQLWTAHSATRDFRDSRWTASEIKPTDAQGLRFTGELTRPKSGYSAVFVESIYAGQTMPFYLSTTVHIAPAQAP